MTYYDYPRLSRTSAALIRAALQGYPDEASELLARLLHTPGCVLSRRIQVLMALPPGREAR